MDTDTMEYFFMSHVAWQALANHMYLFMPGLK
jgi:hypothetical protein